MSAGLLPRAALRLGTGAAVLATSVYLVALPALGGHGSIGLATGVVGIAFVVVAIYACARAARVDTSGATTWGLLGLGLVAFAASAVLYVASEVTDVPRSWLAASAVLGLTFRILAVLAMISFPLEASSTRSRWRARLDLVVVGATVAYLAWGWAVGDLIRSAPRSSVVASAALFALVDLVLVILVVMGSLRRPAGVRDAARLVGVGLLFLAVTDWRIGTLQADGELGTSVVASTASLLAMAFVAAGAWSAAHPAASTAPSEPTPSRWREALPILLAACALGATLATPMVWSGDPVLIALGAGSAMALLAWQVAVLLENDEMVRSLSEEGRRFETLVETAPVAIIGTDQLGRVQHINSEAARLLGKPAEELVGAPLPVEVDDAPIGDDRLRQRLLRGEVLRDMRIGIRRPDGLPLDLVVSAAPVPAAQGGSTSLVWIGSDDGPRLRAMAAMIDIQRVETIEQVAGGIAHEFNNRLAVILGSAEILLEGDGPEDDRELLRAIVSAGRRAAGLVEELTSTTGKGANQSGRCDVNVVVAELASELARRVGSGVAIELELTHGSAIVDLDRSDLAQVLINLVVNAAEAMPTGGSVVVATRLAVDDRDADDARAAVDLVVWDQGVGMEPTVQARIFEPFFSTKPNHGRSRGLGLPAVQGVVLRARGEVRVASAFDVGTTVTIRLPLAAEPEVAPPALPSVASGPPVGRPEPAATPAAASLATILLVDDEAEVRAIARRLLCDAGYAVLEAASAEEAEDLFARDLAVDLLLSDIVMPGRSGVELAESFVDRWPARPALLMSGFAAAPGTGAPSTAPFPLLSKPVGRSDLLAAVAAALEPAR